MTCRPLERSLAGGDGRPRLTEPKQVEHLLECDACRGLWLAGGLLVETGTKPSRRTGGCPSESSLMALLDGTLEEALREPMVGHAASCDACLEELASLLVDLERIDGARALSDVPDALERQALEMGPPGAPVPSRQHSRWVGWGVPLAAAAGLAFLALGLGLLLIDRGSRTPADLSRSVLRGTKTQGPLPLEPRGTVVLSPDGLRFAWRDDQGAGAGRYRLVVSDLEAFETIVDVRLAAGSYTLKPEEAERLRPWVRYHWVVEPLDPGSGAPSEVAEFTIAP